MRKSEAEITRKKVVLKARIRVANFEIKGIVSRHRKRSDVLQKHVENFWIGSD